MVVQCIASGENLRFAAAVGCRLLCREWQAQLQVVCDSQSVGLLQLQTSFLKTTYMTKLSSAQATIAMMLVSAARKECQAAIAELHSLVR